MASIRTYLGTGQDRIAEPPDAPDDPLADVLAGELFRRLGQADRSTLIRRFFQVQAAAMADAMTVDPGIGDAAAAFHELFPEFLCEFNVREWMRAALR